MPQFEVGRRPGTTRTESYIIKDVKIFRRVLKTLNKENDIVNFKNHHERKEI